MIIDFHKNFQKTFKRLPIKIQNKFYLRLAIFEQNPFHPVLNNHAVDAAYPGHRSINVTGDYRALYEAYGDSAVIFMEIGTHAELY